MNRAAGIEHDPSAVLQPATRAQTRWLATQANLARIPLVAAAVAPLVAGVLLVAQAWLLAYVLEAGIVHGAPRTQLLPSFAAIGGLVLARAALAWAAEQAGARAAERIKHDLRLALFQRMLEAGPHWTRQRVSGELASALVEQIEALDGYFARYLPSMGAAAVLPVAFSVIVLPVDVVSGLLLLVTAPLIPLFMALVGWGAEAASRHHLLTFARLSGFFADRLRGLSTLKLYGRAEAETRAVADASAVLRDRTMTVLRVAFLSSAVLEFFAALGVASVAVYIGLNYLGYLDLRGQPLTLQAGFFCLLMAPEVYAPLRQFAAHYHDRGAARAAVSQIEQVFESLPEVQTNSDGNQQTAAASHAWVSRKVTATAGATLRVDGLRIAVSNHARPVLDGVSLSLAPGEHIALMGDSGAGKTTLLEALARLREAQGAIALDGVPLSDWPESMLRQRIALISQKPYLFQGTIADNIRLGRPDASAGELAGAARRAGVQAFTSAFTRGLDEPLASRGRGLSGGQAQRVALARLFLRDPGLILLDEPTAHLDADAQAGVLDELLAFARGRTLLLVTHSEAVAQRLPRRLRLIDGQLREAV